MVVFLVLFALPTTFDLFHTHHEPADDNACPVCHLRDATCADGPATPAMVQRPTLVATTTLVATVRIGRGTRTEPSSRGPPPASRRVSDH